MAKERDAIVAKRMRYIERMRTQKPETVNVQPKGQQPEGSGPRNRHGMPKLPVGQRQVQNWPVLDLGDVPEISLQEWELVVDGEVENPVTLAWSDFMDLPQVDDVSDFHCVTSWSRMDNQWRGVRFSTLAELVVPRDEARFVLCTGYDRFHGTNEAYTTNLPLIRAVEEDVLLVHQWEGQPLPREHGGPVRMITPRLYAWKGTKWIHRIEFLREDRLGFWEERGYSNTAEPWYNDRYRT